MGDLEEKFGKDAVWQAIHEASVENPRIKVYAKGIIQYRSEEKSRTIKRSKPLKGHYAEIKKLLYDPDRELRDYQFTIWGRDAEDGDFEQAARDFLNLPEDDLDMLHIYLQIFKMRPFPLNPDKLINLAVRKTSYPSWENGHLSTVDRVVIAAFSALKKITHPHVRAMALKMIEDSNRIGWAVDLLENNYQEKDWQYLEPITTREMDAYDYHGMGMGIIGLFKVHPSKDAVNSLINVYNRTPCSFCRLFLVESLHSINALPVWMIEECRYDSNIEIREWVKNGFKSLEN